MGHVWLICEYTLNDLKKIDDLVREAPKLEFFFLFNSRERDDNHNKIKLFMIFNSYFEFFRFCKFSS